MQQSLVHLHHFQVRVGVPSVEDTISCKRQRPLTAFNHNGVGSIQTIDELTGLSQRQDLTISHFQHSLPFSPNSQHGILQFHVVRDVQNCFAFVVEAIQPEAKNIWCCGINVLRPPHRQTTPVNFPGLSSANGPDRSLQNDRPALRDSIRT